MRCFTFRPLRFELWHIPATMNAEVSGLRWMVCMDGCKAFQMAKYLYVDLKHGLQTRWANHSFLLRSDSLTALFFLSLSSPWTVKAKPLRIGRS